MNPIEHLGVWNTSTQPPEDFGNFPFSVKNPNNIRCILRSKFIGLDSLKRTFSNFRRSWDPHDYPPNRKIGEDWFLGVGLVGGKWWKMLDCNSSIPVTVMCLYRSPILRRIGWEILSRKNVKFKSRWWFQVFFMFTSTWGIDPIWRAYFSVGLKPPPSKFLFHGPKWLRTLFVAWWIVWRFRKLSFC